jgi:hypothetical protein
MRDLKPRLAPVKRGTFSVQTATEAKTLILNLRLLEKAVETAIYENRRDMPLMELRDQIWTDQAEIVQVLSPFWERAQILHMIRKARRKLNPPEQFLLPGFEALPLVFRVEKRKLHLAQATQSDLQAYLDAMQRQIHEDARVSQIKKLLQLVAKYARKEPEITVREVCQREAR